MGRNSLTCLQILQIRESGSVGSATSSNHLDVIIALFVSPYYIEFFSYDLVCIMAYEVILVCLIRWAMRVEDGPSLCVGC